MDWGLLFYNIPEFQVEPIEIGADGAGGWILCVELSIQVQVDAKNIAPWFRHGVLPAKMVDSLRVKITAEPLEVTGNQNKVCLIDVKRRITPPALTAANCGMSILNLIQRNTTLRAPTKKRL